MIQRIYAKAFGTLLKKPIKLWVLSVISTALTSIVTFGCAGAPLVGSAVTSVLGVGMTKEYLDGYQGREIGFNQLFVGFKNFWHVCGGMMWMTLWLLLWALIPIAGLVMVVIKGYSYSFMPYILITQPEIPIRDALKLSIEKTNGYKGKMFGANILVDVAVLVVSLLLFLFARIPFIGVLFVIINVIYVIALILFLPLLKGIIGVAFYCEINDLDEDYDDYGYESPAYPEPMLEAPAAELPEAAEEPSGASGEDAPAAEDASGEDAQE